MKGKAPVFTSHLFTSHLNSMNAPTNPKSESWSDLRHACQISNAIKRGKVEMTLNKEVS